jgi:hypothetical protein
MASYIPPDDFTDKVMKEVRKIHERRQRQQLLIEKAINGLPVRALLSLAAVLGGVWNLVRIYMMLSPVICK